MAALGLVLLAGCGGGSGKTGNATDSAFVADMTASNETAIKIAQTASDQAEHRQVRELARTIADRGRAQVSVMERIGDDMHHMGLGRGNPGISRREMGMDLNVAAFGHVDRAVLGLMVRHHQRAIRLARMELRRGVQPALRHMAREIVATQTREIAQMRRWQRQWFPRQG